MKDDKSQKELQKRIVKEEIEAKEAMANEKMPSSFKELLKEEAKAAIKEALKEEWNKRK